MFCVERGTLGWGRLFRVNRHTAIAAAAAVVVVVVVVVIIICSTCTCLTMLLATIFAVQTQTSARLTLSGM